MSGLPLFYAHRAQRPTVRRRPAYVIPQRVLVQLCAIGADDRDPRQRTVLRRLLGWIEGRC